MKTPNKCDIIACKHTIICVHISRGMNIPAFHGFLLSWTHILTLARKTINIFS